MLDKKKSREKDSKFLSEFNKRFNDLFGNTDGEIMNLDVAVKIVLYITLGVLILGLSAWLVRHIIRNAANTAVKPLLDSEYDVDSLTGIAPGMIRYFLF